MRYISVHGVRDADENHGGELVKKAMIWLAASDSDGAGKEKMGEHRSSVKGRHGDDVPGLFPNSRADSAGFFEFGILSEIRHTENDRK